MHQYSKLALGALGAVSGALAVSSPNAPGSLLGFAGAPRMLGLPQAADLELVQAQVVFQHGWKNV